MLRTKKAFSILILILSGAAVTVGLTNCNGGGFELAEGCFNDGGDPFFNYSWHLANCGQSVLARSGGTSGVDLNLRATWSSGILGNGVKIRISDDGLENTHEDLKDNFQTSVARSKDFVTGVVGSNYYKTTAPPSDTTDNHGTSVAGLIAAVAGNGIGSRGVAPKASLAIVNFLTATKVGGVSVQTDSNLIQQASGFDFDILNMSWGTEQTVISAPVTAYESQLNTAVTNMNYRGGKGAILIKSAGNSFYTSCYDGDSDPTNNTTCIGNSNFDGDNTNPYQIMVAALNAKGVAATYSSPGANVWISGFGGQFGTSSPAMFTTDRSGCTLGWSKSNAGSSVAFDNGAAPNTNCNYTVTFNGTSSAAPTVSGAVALILEANPNLTWRDVKYILAKTAVPMDYVTTGKIPHPLASQGVTVPTGYSWELPWQTNSAGFKFHNWYGFGKVDVDAAVALAKSYTSHLGTFKETAWFNSGSINLPIGDGSLGGAASSQILVTSGSADDIKIESVQLKANITHTDISQLAIELTSFDGMRSIVINMHNSLKNVHNYAGEVFLTNAFYQMQSGQTWSIKVIDGSADGKAGTLNSWSIKFNGGSAPY